MGNCQAIDNATLVIQYTNGKAEKHYAPISAKEIMKLNPGHYVALLLTTTLYSSSAAAASAAAGSKNAPLRITRIKLLRPTDTLNLGHVYRLVTSQEVMKGLWAKKQAKMKEHQTDKANLDFDSVVRKTDVEKTQQVNQERRHSRSRNKTAVNSAVVSKSRTWQPALNSISEAGS